MPSRNSTLNQSAASLRDILEERSDQFEVLEPSKMYGDGQKNQMNKLNVQLRDYMKMNKDLDDQIASLNSEISKAKHNANYQDDDIKRKIMTVHEQKKTIDTLRIKQKDTTIQLEKVKLRNDNCEGDCKRYNQQIKEMDAKIRNVNDEIDTAQREIANDQAIIDELLPKKKRLEEAQREKEIKHKRRIEELLANRKKTQILPVPEVQKHLPTMLDNYRKSHVDKDAKPAEIKQLEAKVEQARIRSRNLDKEILLTHREKDKVELAIRNLEMEISQAETNCEGVRKQMKQIDANHKKELEEMTVTIERLELEKRGLEQELQNADHELKQVQNQKIGHKAPIEDEVKQMASLLEKWGMWSFESYEVPPLKKNWFDDYEAE